MSNISPFFRDQSQSKYGRTEKSDQKEEHKLNVNESSPLLQPNTSRYRDKRPSSNTSIPAVQPSKQQVSAPKEAKKTFLPLVFQPEPPPPPAAPKSNLSTPPRPSQQNIHRKRRASPFRPKVSSHNLPHTRKSAYTFVEATSSRWVWSLLFCPTLLIALIYALHQCTKYERWNHYLDIHDEKVEIVSPRIMGRSAMIHSQLFVLTSCPLTLLNNSLINRQTNHSHSNRSIDINPSVIPPEISLPISLHLVSDHYSRVTSREVLRATPPSRGYLFDYDSDSLVYVFPLPAINMQDHLFHWAQHDVITSYEVVLTLDCSAHPCYDVREYLFEGYSYTSRYSLITNIESCVVTIVTLILMVKLVVMTWKSGKHQSDEFNYQLTSLGLTSASSSSTSSSPSSSSSRIFFKPLDCILPEQFCSLFLLFSLFLYNNIFGAVTILLTSTSTLQSASEQWVFFCCFIRSVGKYGLWFGLYVMLTGLQYNANSYEERLRLNEMKSSLLLSSSSSSLFYKNSADPLAVSASLLSYDEKVVQVESILRVMYEVFLTKAHPKSSQFLDFILTKTCFLVITYIFVAIYWLFELKVNDFFTSQRVSDWMTVVLVVVFSFWVICVLKALYTTRKKLHLTRYMQSRHRQILFRMINFQVQLTLVGVVLLSATSVWFGAYNIADMTHGLQEYGSLLHFLRYLKVYLGSYGINEMIISPNALLIASDEIQLFVTFFIFSIVIATLPLSKELEMKELQSYVTFRRQLDAPSSSYDRKTSETKNEPFCLELSCFLLEASFQSYFNWQQHQLQQQQRNTTSDVTANPKQKTALKAEAEVEKKREKEEVVEVEEGREKEGGEVEEDKEVEEGPSMDIKRLGLNVLRYFYCPKQAIFGYLSESEVNQDIVIAFRGSTGANLSTDFMFSQSSLPDFKQSKRIYVNKALQRSDQSTSGLCTIDEELQSPDSSYYQSNDDSIVYTATERSQLLDKAQDDDDSSLSIVKCWEGFLSYIPLLRQNFPRVHYGFLHSYLAIREQYMTSVIATMLQHYSRVRQGQSQSRKITPVKDSTEPVTPTSNSHQGNDVITIYFSGHSLGGAIACLAALELSMNLTSIHRTLLTILSHTPPNQQHTQPSIPLPRIILYTFGSPRVGNTAFAQLMNKHVPYHYRLKIDGDLVTMVPKIFGLYQHAGIPVILDEYEKGDLIIQPTVIEDSLFRRTTGNLVNHSLEKYRACLEAVFETSEWEEYLAQEYLYTH